MMVWNLSYAPNAEPNDSQARAAFGILRRDWPLRPAYTALASTVK